MNWDGKSPADLAAPSLGRLLNMLERAGAVRARDAPGCGLQLVGPSPEDPRPAAPVPTRQDRAQAGIGRRHTPASTARRDFFLERAQEKAAAWSWGPWDSQAAGWWGGKGAGKGKRDDWDDDWDLR